VCPSREVLSTLLSIVPMCIIDRDQLRLSEPTELCAWRPAPEQQIAPQYQGEGCLSPCHKPRPLPMSRRDQTHCGDETVEPVPSAWSYRWPSPPIPTGCAQIGVTPPPGTQTPMLAGRLGARHSPLSTTLDD